jgi:hypothetical protein
MYQRPQYERMETIATVACADSVVELVSGLQDALSTLSPFPRINLCDVCQPPRIVHVYVVGFSDESECWRFFK